MKTVNYPEITLKKGRQAALLHGHPWVFSGAIAAISGKPDAGDVVLARDATGRPLALGFFNPHTDIAFRKLTCDCKQALDDPFWQQRLQAAVNMRQRLITAKTNAYRLINAEGDGFPGLIVDVYGSAIVLSIATAGIEKQKEHILAALIDHLKPVQIYERSDSRSRTLEGLAGRTGFLCGEDPSGTVEIEENGLKFAIDYIGGQKTGFFLDQRVNRELLRKLSCNARVLNCFSYTGAFSVYCAAGRAKNVVSLDISKPACAAALCNMERNGFRGDNYPVITADVFEYLRETSELYDLLILDPPAFAKNKRDITKASRGYKEINMQALRHLAPSGLLATFSCSNFIDEELFYRILQGAAQDSGSDLKLLARLEAGPDHPVLLGHREGKYLKGLLLSKDIQ